MPILFSLDINIDDITYVALVKKFKTQRKIWQSKGIVFFGRCQKSGETLDEFFTDLKNLSLSCELGTLREKIVRDIFICNMSPARQVSHQMVSSQNQRVKNLRVVMMNFLMNNWSDVCIDVVNIPSKTKSCRSVV